MNDFIKKINERVSVRDYEPNKKIPKEQLDTLAEVVNNSPTSANGQYFGVVFIEDSKILGWLSEKSKFQSHIRDASIFAVFFIENNQLNAMSTKSGIAIKANKTNLFTTGVVDVAIAATQLQDAAISLGLGTCFIGMVRAYPKYIIEKINLPKENIPILGLTIGYARSKEEIKPKINKVYFNKYDAMTAINNLNDYDNLISKYYLERTNNSKKTTFSEMITRVYKNDTWDTEWNKLVEDYYFKK